MNESDRYEVLEKIGHGSFGVIRKVRRKSDGYVLCRKEISYLQMSTKEREQLQAELSILKGLRHPNIVAYYEREHIKSSSDLHIYMEYCEHGDLGRYIRDMKRGNRLAEEDFVWSVFSQMITALYRCHYGEDPPEVGKNVIGLSSDAKPSRAKSSHAMILHRDLKPENIFLGADASVKLGDFGLSKIMQSHDFASTYVGTPFYMSPEICAAEQYSLHSDIWALGCIMYELCAKEPPFNAKTHYELVQRIRNGKLTPLPQVYSSELKDSISKCLRVNPSTRPTTAQLLNIPMVKLKRKELEIVRVARQVRTKEDLAAKALKDLDKRLAQMDTEKDATRLEIESVVRREWEVKARLEFNRFVQLEKDRLYQDFELQISSRVAQELESLRKNETHQNATKRSSTPDTDEFPQDSNFPQNHQSQSTTGETDDLPSSTDLSELSLESPTLGKSKSTKMGPSSFIRARTMFDGSPMDVVMADPSPAPVASLNLSPRRNATASRSVSRNIFVSKSAADPQSVERPEGEEDEEDDHTDELPPIPTPSRAKPLSSNPFRPTELKRPTLLRQRTAPLRRNGAMSTKTGQNPGQIPQSTKENSNPQILGPRQHQKANTTSPTRGKLKTCDATSPHKGTNNRSSSPTRHQQPSTRPQSRKRADEEMRHAAILNNHVQGRTLVELAQAKTHRGPEDAPEVGVAAQSEARTDSNSSEDTAAADPTIWDPETEDMPSPFLVKNSRRMIAGDFIVGTRHFR